MLQVVCEHDLHHCPVCRGVFCQKCGATWTQDERKWIVTTTIPDDTVTWVLPPTYTCCPPGEESHA